MTNSTLNWAAACAGSSPIPAERSAIAMAAVGVRVDRVRHVPWAQRKQGRSVFIGTNPLAYPVQANLRPELVQMDDTKVWGPDPWRPPPV
jgi:hypothetical protein